MLRLSLHPDGIASRIVNLAEWRAHLLDRLDRDISSTAVFGTPRDVTLAELAIESFYPADQDSAGYLASRAAAARGRAGA